MNYRLDHLSELEAESIAAWLEISTRREPVALTASTTARVPDTLNSNADASRARVRPAAWTTTSDAPIAADKVAR